MLVLSAAVLVIVIDLWMNVLMGLGDTIDFHRHPSQRCDCAYEYEHRRYATEHEG